MGLGTHNLRLTRLLRYQTITYNPKLIAFLKRPHRWPQFNRKLPRKASLYSRKGKNCVQSFVSAK